MSNCVICKKTILNGMGKKITSKNPDIELCQICYTKRGNINGNVKNGNISTAIADSTQIYNTLKKNSNPDKNQKDMIDNFFDYYYFNCDPEAVEKIRVAIGINQEEKEQLEIEDVEEKKEIIFNIKGSRGRNIEVYPNYVVISTGVTIGSVLTHNATDGEKTIYYQDCVGIQWKKPGVTIGYLQLETPGITQNNGASNFFNENTFTFDAVTPEIIKAMRYIKNRVKSIKEMALCLSSPAEEVLKLKQLLDQEIITQEEFTKKKKQLLEL